MSREGLNLSIDSSKLVSSLFALLPIPIAIVDENDRIVIANSHFNEIFPDTRTLLGARLHEVTVPGCGTFDLDVLPLNDQGFKIVYGVDISKEVTLRRQLTQLERKTDRTAKSDQHVIVCDLNALIRDVAHEREPFTRQAKISVTLDLDPQLPRFKGNPEEMAKVLIGLMTNAEQAILFANRRFGAIHIKTWVERDGVRLSVCDNGCGIQTRDISASGIEPLLREIGKTRPIGMGLCAEIIKDTGGELFCWSTYDAGSTYTMELPSIPARSAGRTRMGDTARLAGRSLLVIDDDVHMTELMFDVLTRQGAAVDLAESEREALPFLKSRSYDLIICDQHIPGIGGDRFCDIVESLAPGVFQRFLFVTEDGMNAETRRLFSQAGVEFIRRPFHINDLLSTTETLLNQQQPQGS